MARVVKVTVNKSNTGLVSSEKVTVGGIPITTNRLDHLADVDAGGEVEGATVVYDADTDKYYVKKLDYADIEGTPGSADTNIDGGTF